MIKNQDISYTYKHKTCNYKSKIITKYYQFNNYTGYVKQTTRYNDYTNSYQKCI